MAVEVRDNAEKHRYEAWLDDARAGVLLYRMKDENTIVLVHTEVKVEGRGVGSALVRGALDDVRRRGLRLVPECPFVRSWLEKHPDHADLT